MSLGWRLSCCFFGHPDASVVAEALAHQRELGLKFALDRDASWVNLRVAGVGEVRALLVGTVSCRDVAAFGVGREKVGITVAARGENHRVTRVAADFAGDEVAHDDALGVAVDDHEIEHLGLRVHLDHAEGDLAFQGLVRTHQKLLAGLAARVEGARDLRAAEGTVGKEAAVLAGKRARPGPRTGR